MEMGIEIKSKKLVPKYVKIEQWIIDEIKKERERFEKKNKEKLSFQDALNSILGKAVKRSDFSFERTVEKGP